MSLHYCWYYEKEFRITSMKTLIQGLVVAAALFVIPQGFAHGIHGGQSEGSHSHLLDHKTFACIAGAGMLAGGFGISRAKRKKR